MKKLMKWREMAARLRMDVIEMSHRAKTAHLASSLSCIDILTVLYSSILKKINTSLKKSPSSAASCKFHDFWKRFKTTGQCPRHNLWRKIACKVCKQGISLSDLWWLTESSEYGEFFLVMCLKFTFLGKLFLTNFNSFFWSRY